MAAASGDDAVGTGDRRVSARIDAATPGTAEPGNLVSNRGYVPRWPRECGDETSLVSYHPVRAVFGTDPFVSGAASLEASPYRAGASRPPLQGGECACPVSMAKNYVGHHASPSGSFFKSAAICSRSFSIRPNVTVQVFESEPQCRLTRKQAMRAASTNGSGCGRLVNCATLGVSAEPGTVAEFIELVLHRSPGTSARDGRLKDQGGLCNSPRH